jgi:hypothetical protein
VDDVGKSKVSRVLAILRAPAGRLMTLAVTLILLVGPAWLFFDPTNPIPRDAVQVYRLYSDDYAYLAFSRTFDRTRQNLFVPHNTHVVPSWRVLTWGMSVAAGRLERLPDVLAVASYGILVAVMMLTGRIVEIETRRRAVGLGAMALVGTTSIMLCPATWYSAGQTLWAGFGILATLYYVQGYRRKGNPARLGLAAISAIVAGWFWTIGYMAGPVGAVYLWVSGGRRRRLAAAVPCAASFFAAAMGLGLGGRHIDSRVSFHGRTVQEAFGPLQGAFHTAQAIPEKLVFGNLGLTAETTQWQGVVLTLCIVLIWLRSHRPGWRFNPLECAGGTLILGSYLVECMARGYLPYSSLRDVVPWYDAIPHIGAVLFVSGWAAGPRDSLGPRKPAPATRFELLSVLLLMVVLIVLNRPRVEAYWASRVPGLTAKERDQLRIPSLQQLRNNALAFDLGEWQRRHLRKLDAAERVAQRLKIGRSTIHQVFGRVDAPDLPPSYDAAELLDLPLEGVETDPGRVRRALADDFEMEPLPRPKWLMPGDIWPPKPEKPS